MLYVKLAELEFGVKSGMNPFAVIFKGKNQKIDWIL